ncbi:MAG TPA: ROK family protein [Parafilimonas sp.]|nr:ROK family protein [Parafilimonas sp.]
MKKIVAYKKEIVKELFFGGELSAAELSALTNKSLPLVTKILNELIEDDYVIENGYAHSTGGRRPQMYSLKDGITYIVAVAMDQYITSIAIINAKNQVIGETETIELLLKDNPDAPQILADFIRQFIEKSRIPADKFAGIGIGMPGFIDAEKGINYSLLKSPKDSLVNYLADAIGIPVFIDNDSSLIALAELRMGIARNYRNAMVINLSWGIGLGMIINGKLFRGDDGFAGEFSHMTLFANDKICSCGKNGCLETEASLYTMVENAMKGIRDGKPTNLKSLSLNRIEDAVNSVMSAAVKGDKFAVELLSDTAYNIGRGVAILIHIINPGQIILSGRGVAAGKLWLAPLQQALNVHCIPRLAANTVVQLSKLGGNAGLMGAACLVIENLSKDYIKKNIIKPRVTAD